MTNWELEIRHLLVFGIIHWKFQDLSRIAINNVCSN